MRAAVTTIRLDVWAVLTIVHSALAVTVVAAALMPATAGATAAQFAPSLRIPDREIVETGGVFEVARKSRRNRSEETQDEEAGAPKSPGKAPPPAASPSATEAPAADKSPSKAAQPEPLAPPPPPPPPPVVWSQTEIIDALRDCIGILGPITATVEILPPIRDGQCGTPAPVRLSRIGTSPGVEIVPPVIINCRVAAKLDVWIRNTLQPQAMAEFGHPITRLNTLSSYDCRNRIGSSLTRVSEHAFANAIDVAAVTTDDGHKVDVLAHWGTTARDLRAAVTPQVPVDAAVEAHVPPTEVSAVPAKKRAGKRKGASAAVIEPIAETNSAVKSSASAKKGAESGAATNAASSSSKKGKLSPELPVAPPGSPVAPRGSAGRALNASNSAPSLTAEARFLRNIHKGACGVFGTALSPEANEAHRNHLHLDLAARRHSAFCE